jgi:hypothetical protein
LSSVKLAGAFNSVFPVKSETWTRGRHNSSHMASAENHPKVRLAWVRGYWPELEQPIRLRLFKLSNLAYGVFLNLNVRANHIREYRGLKVWIKQKGQAWYTSVLASGWCTRKF